MQPTQPTQPDPVHWEQTPATAMADVAISESGTIWLAGLNGTIWHSIDGQSFVEEKNVSGFSRIGAGNDDREVFAVGRDNHTLWHYVSAGNWTQTPASGVADVAVDRNHVLWTAGTNGLVSYSTDRGQSFHPVKAQGFCRVGTHSQEIWAVGCNGTLWRYQRSANAPLPAGEWGQTDASDIADVAGDNGNSIWVAGKNGTVWTRPNRIAVAAIGPPTFQQVAPSAGYASIAVGRGKVYAVRRDGTLWRYKP